MTMLTEDWSGHHQYEDDSPNDAGEPLAAFMEAYQTPGRGNRGCPKGVCREGSGYVASIRINKRQQKGPVRGTISEATRDRAQMMFMKATRTSADVELWIKSLKRKKRRSNDKPLGLFSGDSSLMSDPSLGRQALAQALEQLMIASTQPLAEDSYEERESTLMRIYQQQAELRAQQISVLQELLLTQQNILFHHQQDGAFDDDEEEDDE